jgi:O-antigen/teichoic acid export membrane protein
VKDRIVMSAETPTPPGDAPTGSPGPEAPRPGIKRAVLTGAAWIVIGQMAAQLVRMVSSMVLTRLIYPEAYGLMDMANVVIQGLHMFADVGLSQAAVQSPRGEDQDFLDTAWTIQVLRGICLWVATALVAWPTALIYEEPFLRLLLPAVGFSAVLEGLVSTSRFVLDRRLHRGRLMVVEVSATVLTFAVTFTGLWLTHPDLVRAFLHGDRPELAADETTVWVMLAGSFASLLLYVVASHLLYLPGFRNHLRWDPSVVRELMHFGKWIFFSTLVTFLAFESDRLIVPKLMSFGISGIYNRATSLADLAAGLSLTLATQLIYPTYARLQQVGRDIRPAYVTVHSAAASFGAMLVTSMLATGPAAVHFLYGPAYREAGWMLQFLAVGAWFQMLENTAGISLLALGQARSLMVTNGSRLIGFLIFVPLFWWAGKLLGPAPAPPVLAAGTVGLLGSPLGQGPLLAASSLFPERPTPTCWEGTFLGLLVGFVAADVLRYLVTIWLARREGMSAWRYDLGLSALIVLFSLASYAVGRRLALLWLGFVGQTRWNAFADFLCVGTIAVLFWAATVALGRATGRFKLRPNPE